MILSLMLVNVVLVSGVAVWRPVNLILALEGKDHLSHAMEFLDELR